MAFLYHLWKWFQQRHLEIETNAQLFVTWAQKAEGTKSILQVNIHMHKMQTMIILNLIWENRLAAAVWSSARLLGSKSHQIQQGHTSK